MIGSDFSTRWPAKHRGFAYVFPILFVGVAAIITDFTARVFMAEPIGLLMLSAVIATASLAGFGPALLAIALALVAFQYDLTPPRDFFVWKLNFLEVNLSEAPRLVLFAIVSFIVSFVIAAQGKATEALRRSRDELRGALQDLKRTELSAATCRHVLDRGAKVEPDRKLRMACFERRDILDRPDLPNLRV